jgi:hypothetical protein
MLSNNAQYVSMVHQSPLQASSVRSDVALHQLPHIRMLLKIGRTTPTSATKTGERAEEIAIGITVEYMEWSQFMNRGGSIAKFLSMK